MLAWPANVRASGPLCPCAQLGVVDSALELALRQSIMDWVAERAVRRGGWLTRDELLGGFTRDGESLALIDQSRGIRNPRALEATLSIVSSPQGPYQDWDSDDGLLHYAYRHGDANGSDNRKLRRALALGVPLILFVKPQPGLYVPIHPVYVVADEPDRRSFAVALDESFRFMSDLQHLTDDQRRYALRLSRQRLHQPLFRGQVIHAYNQRCAICTLHHPELLDAAHIIADGQERGDPVVVNGLSLCKIHHSAYDQRLLGVSPDYEVAVNRDLLAETDGPMLRHGLQEMHGRRLLLPEHRADWPDRGRLAVRFDSFRQAS